MKDIVFEHRVSVNECSDYDAADDDIDDRDDAKMSDISVILII